MDAADIEILYQSLRKSHVAMNAMYLSGATIKLLAKQLGLVEPKDDRNRVLGDLALYCVTELGTFRVE